MRRFQYFTILLVFCLAFSALVGCGAQKEEPAMKTFENKNLTVNYPEGWKVSELENEENETVTIRFDLPKEPANKTIIDILISRDYILPDIPGNPGSTRSNERISDIDFIALTDSYDVDETEIKTWYANKNKDSIMIVARYAMENREIVKKIIDTLKFKF